MVLAVKMHSHVAVDHSPLLLFERGEVVEVRGEETGTSDLLDDVLGDGSSDAEPIERGGATTQFVDDDERVRGGSLEYDRGLEHLCHERAHSLLHGVASAHASEDAVHHLQRGALARHEGAYLRHHNNAAHGADVRALAPHVGPRHHLERKVKVG